MLTSWACSQVPYPHLFEHFQDFTTFPDSLFQCLTTLPMKKLFLKYSLNLPWHNLRQFLYVLTRFYWEKKLTPTWFHPPLREFWRMIRFPCKSPFLQAKCPPLAASHQTCVLPFPSSIPFFGRTPAPQCPFCTEGSKTEHRIWGLASPVPSTADGHCPGPAA